MYYNSGDNFGGTIYSATATAPGLVSLDRTSLNFAASSNDTGFTAQTPAQTIRLTQNSEGLVTWTAASTASWLVISPTSGNGSTTLTVSTRFAPGLTASQTGQINLALTGGGSIVAPINVALAVASSTSAPSPPFGVFDTPLGDATVLAGSIAVTGWTLDNVGIKRVELWRDLQTGETTAYQLVAGQRRALPTGASGTTPAGPSTGSRPLASWAATGLSAASGLASGSGRTIRPDPAPRALTPRRCSSARAAGAERIPPVGWRSRPLGHWSRHSSAPHILRQPRTTTTDGA